MKWSLLCVLFVLAALAVGATQAMAAPEIVGYQVIHGRGSCGAPDYYQKVCAAVRTSNGSYDGLTFSVLAPGATEWSSNVDCSWWDDQQQAMVYTWRNCLQPELPAVGRYQLRVTPPNGRAVSVATGETTAFPQDPVELVSPLPGGMFDSPNPTLHWEPYAFPSDPPGTPGGELGMVQVWTYDGGAWPTNLISRDCLLGEAAADATVTGWTYSAGFPCADTNHVESLSPGYSYDPAITLGSVGHAMENNGWYTEERQVGAPLSIAGPTPVLEFVNITAGVSAYPERAVYAEELSVRGTTLNGGDKAKLQLSGAAKAFRPQAGATGAVCCASDLRHGEYWTAHLDGPPAGGPYGVELLDQVSGQRASVTYSLTQPVEAPVVTYPQNGGVIAAGSAPTFTWTSPPNCCTQLAVEEIPADGLPSDYVWLTCPQETFVNGRQVWATCLSGDATSGTYSGEPLQAGHRYRLHVMVNTGEGEPVFPDLGWPLFVVSDTMVDFTVE